MKTKDRILHVSLALFNELGEPNVTTVDISNEMDISPGNLYYHYRNKDEIVEQIFAQYDTQLQSIINTHTAIEDLVEYWLMVKLILEKNWGFRFIYRDLYNINSKYKSLHRKILRILNAIEKSFDSINHLLDLNVAASDPHFSLISGMMTQTLLTWPQFQKLRKESMTDADLMSQSAYTTFSHLAGFLQAEQKAILHELALSY